MKEVYFGKEARDGLRRGINKLADTVTSTLGPKGKYTLLGRQYGPPVVTNDGVTIAREIDFTDPLENMGAQLVKEVAIKTNDVAGDGTTTATLLAQFIVNHGLDAVDNGEVNTVAIRRGIENGLEQAIKILNGLSRDVKSQEDIARIGIVSAGDELIGQKVAEAIEAAGKDGVVTIQESKQVGIHIDKTNGLEFRNGYMSPHFVNQESKMKAVLSEPSILLIDDKLESVSDVMPIINSVLSNGGSLVIIANDFSEEAITSFAINKLQGTLSSVLVKSPGFGQRRSAELMDIAALTGAVVVSQEKGMKLIDMDASVLGSAKSVEVSEYSTVIVDGFGDREVIETRKNDIREIMDAAVNQFEREQYQERVAKLSSGVAIIKIGANTEAEMLEKKFRIEDALMATQAAVEEGIVSGGGSAPAFISKNIEVVGSNDDEKLGVQIVKDALLEPLRVIAENSGFIADEVLEIIINKDYGYGFNAETGEYGDAFEMGVIDPTKVVKSALTNAVSIANLILISNSAVLPMEVLDNAGN